ncbi:flagellar hook-basal body complex protein [Phaeobacter gallaeciensis]|uniref:flagellar hook protein FlgE n=1 Tax=Phaeobacter gallaeciensis TaxID=60890 RepID=UPI00237FFB1B|nr:flagellar hook-basal body complex protein [Phaeobacter gallaeciensis]MDE4276160.1 flagellar hook-basal body complex protein [Phaeobacter gallaeciensis]MDE4301331.1 flagellar hook-basal body complex protein [Phaeobacter gallaeciensis]MDE5186485.1 flagellar hook-basal body complex protein [Phaeobacter gallaeciensis]
MTISSSLYAGVSGLGANASRLASISDNIANSSTAGYKRVQTDFHSIVAGSSGGAYSAGGVRTTNVRLIDQRGPLVTTDNPTDLAVRGSGFLPVTTLSEIAAGNGAPTMRLTTAGSFSMNSDGYLATESGLALLGWPTDAAGNTLAGAVDSSDGLEPVYLNKNQLVGEPTTKMQIGANLPATATEAGATSGVESLSIEYFDNLGSSENLDIEFTPTVPATGKSNQWTMTIKDTASGGAVVGEYTLEFDDSRTDGGNLASVTDVSGGAYDAATGSVIVTVDGGPIEINIGLIGENDGFTQVSDTFAPATITKDGATAGNLLGVDVDTSGFVRANYSTGASRILYKIPLVDMPNPNGMVSMDYQTFLPSADSGAFFLWNAGDGPTGEIAGFTREESSTDVAGELTNMIQTQRAYSSNAKVIQTVDEMLQETTNIKR